MKVYIVASVKSDGTFDIESVHRKESDAWRFVRREQAGIDGKTIYDVKAKEVT